MISLDLTFLIQIVNFVIILAILNFALFRPIRKVLAEREADIAGAREKAETVDRGVQEKLALYEARLREVKAQANEERSALIKAAQAEEHGIVDSARKEAADAVAAIKNRVTKEAADARELLKQQAAALSTEICEKVLGRSL